MAILNALLARWFGIDTRSLAVVRIGAAAVVLVDLGYRATALRAFYTEDGVLPRDELVRRHLEAGPGLWSLHLVSGELWYQAALFALAGWFALQLGLGYRTRRASIASAILLVSLQHRCPVIKHGGDQLLACLLFWLAWLPSGLRWSVDAARSPAPAPRQITTVASAAFLLQLAAMYVCSALLKDDPAWSGSLGDTGAGQLSAVWMALSNSHFARASGHWIAQHPELCRILTWLTYQLELYGVIVAFSPVFPQALRLLCVIAFWLFHGSLYATMHLGHFPATAMVFWCGFLPAAFWDGLAARWPAIRWPTWLRDLGARLPGRPERPIAELGLLGNTVAAAFLAYAALWNLRGLDHWKRRDLPERWLPHEWSPVGRFTGLAQEWSMFAPHPVVQDGWYVVRGRLGNGRVVDLWALIDGRFERASDAELYDGPAPELPDTPEAGQARGVLDRWGESYPMEDWQRYLVNLGYDAFERDRPLFLAYLRRRWDERIGRTPGYSDRESARLERDLALFRKWLDALRKAPERHQAAIERYERELADAQQQKDALDERRRSRQLVEMELLYFTRRLPKDPREPIPGVVRKVLWTWSREPTSPR